MIAKIPWVALALLHLAPALAFFRPASMTSLYGLDAASPLLPLMQHRAALFICILIAAVWAMFDPGARKLAVVIIAISMLSFLGLYVAAGHGRNGVLLAPITAERLRDVITGKRPRTADALAEESAVAIGSA